MKKIGIRFYILFNIVAICTLGIMLLGIISFKITEQFAIKGKIDGIRTIIKAFERNFYQKGNINGGKEFLERSFESDTWAVLTDKTGTHLIGIKDRNLDAAIKKELTLVMLGGKPRISTEGASLIPFSLNDSLKMIFPLSSRQGKGAIYVHQSLKTFNTTLKKSRKLIIAWIVLFSLIITTFGYYMLSSTVVRPLQKLIDVTHSISKGTFKQKEKELENISKIAEISSLYEALKNMYYEIEEGRGKLMENIKKLEEANAKILETQKELLFSEKLASMGKLSAGIAHEIGNPLSAISGYVEILKRSKDMDIKDTHSYLTKIEAEIDRINTIIKSLLDYSRPKDTVVKEEDINDIVKEVKKILSDQGTLKEIDLEINLENSLSPVKVDRNHILQVLINLILNAKDALKGKGKIRIATSATPSGDIQIQVSDNGPGIDKNIIDKIFDPFFTTKEPGFGTGLGLSVSQRIIEQYNGTISVRSTPGEGTCFEIVLPSCEEKTYAKNTIN